MCMSTNTDNAPLSASTGLPSLPHMSDRRFIFLLPSTRKGLGLGSENSNHLGKRVITESSIMENMRFLQPRRNAAALTGSKPSLPGPEGRGLAVLGGAVRPSLFPEQPAYSFLTGKSACCSNQATLEDSLKENLPSTQFRQG